MLQSPTANIYIAKPYNPEQNNQPKAETADLSQHMEPLSNAQT